MAVERTWSIDDGVGDVKAFNGTKAFILPNFVHALQEKPENDFEEEFNEPESHIAYFDEMGRGKLVGRGVQLLADNPLWDAQENKHLSVPRFMAVFKTMLGLMAREEMDNEIHLNPLVMSLPVNQMTEGRKKQLVDLVKKEHNINIQLDGGNEDVIKTVVVKSLVIKSQPFGSFAYRAMDKKGTIKDPQLRDKRTVVFDLGTRTLNVLSMRGFAEGTGKASFTLPRGMFEAWSTLKDEVMEHHQQDLPISTIKRVASTEVGFGRNGLLVSGEDISKLRDAVYHEHADALLSEFDAKFAGAKDEINLVLLTGGGSNVLRAWLEQGIKARFPNAEVETLSNTATAEGLYNYGVFVAQDALRKKTAATKKRTADSAKKELNNEE